MNVLANSAIKLRVEKIFYKDNKHPWLKDIIFENINAQELLQNAEKNIEVNTKPPAWVFDLDSTLFNLSIRNQNIFAEFLRTHPKPPIHWQKALPFLDSESHKYDIEESFRDIFSQWDSFAAPAQAAALWKEFEPYWYYRFFSNWPMTYDIAYPGATQFVGAVLELGHEVVYLTGRDRPRTHQGTLDKLREAYFPLNRSTHLMMKPHSEMGDLEFKFQVSRELRSRFDIRVSIDNEPENLVMFAECFPSAHIVFFHSIMSLRVPQKNFHDVLGQRRAYRMQSYL